MTVDDFNLIANYLARRDIKNLSFSLLNKPIDVLIYLGNSLIEPIHLAAQAIKEGLTKHLLISGGIGHSTKYLYDTVAAHPIYHSIKTKGRAEADIIHDILVNYLGLDDAMIVIENNPCDCKHLFFILKKSRKTPSH